MTTVYPVIMTPPERRAAWQRYEEHFGEEYPEELTYEKYGDDWRSEVEDIARRIATNDPA